MTGRLITFEGPEGGGKTTHIARLTAFLESKGIRVVKTREPGGTRLGEAIRAMLQHDAAGETPSPRAELLLFLASRAHLVDSVIKPALAEGAWVLCDRFSDSTLAYQGYGRGLDLAEIRALDAFARGGLAPDMTFLLDVSPEESHARVRSRGGEAPDRFEREHEAFHARLREGFHALARENPDRIRMVDAAEPVEVVAAAIQNHVNPLLPA